MTDVRRRIDAHIAGQLTELQLRESVQQTVRTDPQLANSCVALIAGLERSAAISQTLAAALNEEIIRVSGSIDPVMAGSEASAEARTQFRMRRSSLQVKPMPMVDVPIDTVSNADAPIAVSLEMSAEPRFGATTGASAWDSPERLAEPVTPLFVGSVLSDRFELKEELGRGGMGVVFKALDRATLQFNERSPYVAIKLLNEHFKRHPLAVRSLQREASKARKLAHPNIVTVFDFDRDGGNVYMVMELLSGRSLEELLKSDAANGLPVRRVVEIVRSLGAALAYAHERGLVHADFKPGNAFITDDGTVKVLDFGIARAAQTRAQPSEKTRFDVSKLEAISPAYASCEMLRGESADPRDDLYALGCVTYELLTGVHPFKRIEADKARDAGLQAAPISGVSRGQWQALRQSLAFQRDARTPNVHAFITAFCDDRRGKLWWPVAAACIAVIAAAVAAAPRLWESYRANVLAQHLSASDQAVFDRALADMHGAPADVRARALQIDSARESLLRHYAAMIKQAIAAPAFDFDGARAKLADLHALFPDSSEVASLTASVHAAAETDLAEQLADRDKFLTRGILIRADGKDNLAITLDIIRKIDANNSGLRDPRIAVAYSAAARRAADMGQWERAKNLVDAGLLFAAVDPVLVDLTGRINSELLRANEARQLLQVKQHLLELNPSASDYMERLLAQREDLTALMRLSPGDPLLTTLQNSLQTVVSQRLKQRLQAQDVAGAQSLLLNVGDLLSEGMMATSRAAVMELARAQQTQALSTLDQLRRAVLTGRLAAAGGAGAFDLYAQLRATGASPDVLSEARDLLAYGQLKEARRDRARGDTTAQSEAVTAGVALRPSASLQRRLEGVRKPPGPPEPTSAADLDGARQSFTELLRTSTLGTAELAAMAETLDRLDALGSSPQEQDAGLRQIEDRVIGEISRIQQVNGVDQAQLFAQQASATLFTSVRIADVARHLRSSEIGVTRSFSPEVLAARDQINILLAHPEATQRWADKFRDLVQKLASSIPDDQLLENAQRVAVAKFLDAAAAARTHKNLTEASTLLAIGREIDPQSPELVAQSKAVADEQSAKNDTQVHEEQQQGLEVLKRRLEAELSAGDMTSANGTAAVLRRMLAGSVYVTTDMPRMLISEYLVLTKSQLAGGSVNAALQTLAEARKKFGTSSELKDLEKRYVVIGDEYDRVSTAVMLNAATHTAYLERIKNSEGADYPTVEHMLAKTLANRIADLRAADRGGLTTPLLESGDKIFPEYASILEKGTAGVLSNGPITVNPE